MSNFIFAVCIGLCLAQNAFAQLGLGMGKGITANKVSGNSVVSNNIAIGNSNFGGADAKALAAKIGSNLASNSGKNIGNVGSNNIGLNLANGGTNLSGFSGVASGGSGFTSGASNLAIGTSNLATGGSGSLAAGTVNAGFSANRASNFASNNIGSGSISLGNVPVSNFKFGEIELVKDVPANTGYSGDLPIIGYVTFEGYIPAEGTVSVVNDGCACSS